MDSESLVSVYLEDLASRATPRHVERVRQALERFLAHVGDDGATAVDLIRWRAARLAKGVSPETANKEVGFVRAAWGFGEILGLGESPFARIRPIPVREGDRRRSRRAMSDDELRAFLAAAHALDRERPARVPQAPVWRFLAETGARRGEAVALRWSDVQGDEVVFRAETTKARRSRAVPITERLAADLELHRRWAGAEREPVLRTPRGSAWAKSPDNLWRSFRTLARRAGLDVRGLSPHALRHTFVTRLLRSSVEPRVVQELAGHADIETTLRVYRHVAREEHRAGLDRALLRVG